MLNKLAGSLLPDSLEISREIAYRALENANSSNDLSNKARAEYNIGDSWFYGEDFQKAIEWFGKSGETHLDAGNLLDAANAFNDMAYVANQINQYKKALQAYQKSLNLLLEIDDEENLPAVLINIGQVYSATGMPDSAIFYNKQAAALSDIPGREEELSAAMNNLGFIYKNLGNFDKAIEYYNRALAISKKTGDDFSMAIDLNNIGNVYIHWEKYDLAKGHLMQSLNIYDSLNNRAGQEVSLNNIAYIYQQTGKLDSAMILFRKSAKIAEELGRMGNLAVRKNNIGMLYYDMGKYNEAVEFIQEGLEIHRKLGQKQQLAGALQNLGAVYLKMGQLTKAKRYLDEALEMSRELEAKLIMQRVYESLSRMYELQDDHAAALKAFRQYSAIKDSLFTEQSQERLAEMQARYETEKKQQRIELLIKDNRLQQAELRKKQITLFSLTGGIIILAVSAIIIGLMYVQKSRANRKLVEKNLELLSEEEKKSEQDQSDSIHSVIKDEDKAAIVAGLENLMKNERLFTKKQLSLSHLAAALNTNTAYLSRIINEHYRMNFSNFLSGYRIREAQKLFANNQHKSMTLEGIAATVGFKSRSTFHSAFKKITGVTPSVYIKNLNQIIQNHEFEKTQ